MDLRTTFPVSQSDAKIGYDTPLMFIGSCFAAEMGGRLLDAKFPVLINPSGPVYNPLSVASTLQAVMNNKKFEPGELFNNNGLYLSFGHYTEFSSENQEECLTAINEMTERAHSFLLNASFLFITFGTARIYRLKSTGEAVSNCHKLPENLFTRHLLSVNEVAEVWEKILSDLKVFNKDLKIVFTVSPVRHMKDGAHGNQISKSVLLLAVEELLRNGTAPSYFPAYEIVMDDLRDYRFYGTDMLHPSEPAIEYIWEKFAGSYLSNETLSVSREVVKIMNAVNHRIGNRASGATKQFAEKMLRQISEAEALSVSIDFSSEKEYFLRLLK